MKIAFGYIRRSSYKQQENNSVEIQKQHIQEFAKRNNLNVPDEFIFIEDVTSAYSRKANQRKELMRLGKKMIEMGVTAVIFHDISRMDRTGYSFTLDFYRPMLKKIPNLKVYTTKSNEPIDPDDTSIKMNFLLFQHESEVKSERALSVLVNDLQQEKPNRPGARAPFGYTQKEKKLIPNNKAEIVSLIYFLYSWGQSLKKIAFLLNEANIPAPKGNVWRPSSIDNILKNPVYTGDLRWNIPRLREGQKHYFFEDTHEPIISEFSLQLHRKNKRLQNKYGRLDTPFLFLNKIKCLDCHQPMITQNGSTTRNGKSYQYQYYVCKKCNYKVDSLNVHNQLVPKIFNKIQRLSTSSQIKNHSLEHLEIMLDETESQIHHIVKQMENLEQKLSVSRKIQDKELEIQILSLTDHYQKSLDEFLHCKNELLEIEQGVESNQFFTRFQDILHYRLGSSEKRLILLYFVDYAFISPNQKSYVQYKKNLFSNLEHK